MCGFSTCATAAHQVRSAPLRAMHCSGHRIAGTNEVQLCPRSQRFRKEATDMAWIWLKSVPWATILSNAPALVDSTRRLIEKVRSSPPEGVRGEMADATIMQRRVVELQAQQTQTAELLQSLAKSNQDVAQAIAVLTGRVRLLSRVIALLALALLVLALLWLRT
jgi:hypothetical protein